MVAPVRARAALAARFLLVALLAAAAFCAADAGLGYSRFVRLRRAMDAEAARAGTRSDETIRAELRAAASDLGLPPAAQRVVIQRRGRPREITIRTSWPDTILVLGFPREITYRPAVRAPL